MQANISLFRTALAVYGTALALCAIVPAIEVTLRQTAAPIDSAHTASACLSASTPACEVEVQLISRQSTLPPDGRLKPAGPPTSHNL